jgi:hypothetical protein
MNKLKKYYDLNSTYKYIIINKQIIIYDILIADKGYITKHYIMKNWNMFGIKIEILKWFDNEKKY